MIARLLAAILALALAAASAAAQDFRDVVRAVDASIGRVLVSSNTGSGVGSGFVLSRARGSSDLFLLTNEHVIEGAREIMVAFGVGPRVVTYAAEVEVASRRLDLAVLRLRRAEGARHQPPAIPIAQREIEKAETVAALGFPAVSDDLLGGSDQVFQGINNPDLYSTTFTQGTVSKTLQGSWGKGPGAFEQVQHTAVINGGNSGGPLIDRCGQVAGVNTASATRGDGTFWASSSATVTRFLNDASIPFQTRRSACGEVTGPGSLAGGGGAGGLAGQAVLVLIAGGIAAALAGAGAFMVWHTRRMPAPVDAAPGFAASTTVEPPRRSERSGAGGTVFAIRVSGDGGRDQVHPVSAEAARRGVVIGRGGTATVQIPGTVASRAHAKLSLEDRRLMLTDLGSRNGTRVDGKTVKPNSPVQINSSSRIEIGGQTLSIGPAARGRDAEP